MEIPVENFAPRTPVQVNIRLYPQTKRRSRSPIVLWILWLVAVPSLYAQSVPAINSNGIVNGAGWPLPPAPVAPGSIISIYGTNFAPGASHNGVSATVLPLPTTISGTRVLLNGTAAPLLYVNSFQINAVVPWEAAGSSLTAQVISNSVASSVATVALAMAAPGIFLIGHASDGSLITPSKPAVPGEYITIYCTGLGPVTSQPSSGAPALASPLSRTTATTGVWIGTVPGKVTFSGLAPGFVGLYQMNVQVPASAPTGHDVNLMLLNWGNSTATTIAVQSSVQVSVSPAGVVTLQPGGTFQFAATVAGTTDTAVQWSVNGIPGGNSTVGAISPAGLYTAPSTVPNPNTVTIPATSTVDPTRPGTAVVIVTGGAVATLTSLIVTPTTPSVELGIHPQFTATANFHDGATMDLTSSATWSSSDPSVAVIDGSGAVTTKAQGQTTIQATYNSVNGATVLTVTPPGHFLLKTAGLYTQFECRGWASGYWSGDTIQRWTQFDSVVGSTIAQEVSLQLDRMKAMGVNTITYELRTSDPTNTGSFTPPGCTLPAVLGLQWPQPTSTELTNLVAFFDLVQSKDMRVLLRLVNTHMEEQPPTNSQTWLGAILGVIGKHPALNLVLLEGNTHTTGSGSQEACGIPAEPPLWMGPSSVAGKYVQWAIGFAMSLGIPARKLSAEAVVGDVYTESYWWSSPEATGGHLWPSIVAEKKIFDNLGIPAVQRTYALSFYERSKCSRTRQSFSCTDLNPHDWADQTLQYVTSVVGTGNGARIVAPEMGLATGDPAQWNTQHALESLIFLLQKYGVDGGTFYRWTNSTNAEDTDPTLGDPVKRRGAAFVYNPVEKEVVDMGGFHLPDVPNGSFEGATGANGVPGSWIPGGNGTVTRYLLTQEPGQPEVPSRGVYAMRMVTGSGLNDSVRAASVMIPASPSTSYTTTSNLRFAWTGDPNPSGPPTARPQVFIDILYFQTDGTPSAIRAQDSFAYFQENSTKGFATFPVQYTTPRDNAFVRIQFGSAHNGLPTAITLDVDNVR